MREFITDTTVEADNTMSRKKITPDLIISYKLTFFDQKRGIAA